ncbi:hypothetical protein MSAN_00962700 [Mycena sanguinolenta]|uniref:Uncharacterized protein n=1 Tax=Mycena sanguinolenta TaxID=230812 RepID=A0A8H6YTU0_9AGAR|nr:hypothetical protein MSAN_00962700 [Mycena sanguinolenta]
MRRTLKLDHSCGAEDDIPSARPCSLSLAACLFVQRPRPCPRCRSRAAPHTTSTPPEAKDVLVNLLSAKSTAHHGGYSTCSTRSTCTLRCSSRFVTMRWRTAPHHGPESNPTRFGDVSALPSAAALIPGVVSSACMRELTSRSPDGMRMCACASPNSAGRDPAPCALIHLRHRTCLFQSRMAESLLPCDDSSAASHFSSHAAAGIHRDSSTPSVLSTFTTRNRGLLFPCAHPPRSSLGFAALRALHTRFLLLVSRGIAVSFPSQRPGSYRLRLPFQASSAVFSPVDSGPLLALLVDRWEHNQAAGASPPDVALSTPPCPTFERSRVLIWKRLSPTVPLSFVLILSTIWLFDFESRLAVL